jgi:hypothetical protein
MSMRDAHQHAHVYTEIMQYILGREIIKSKAVGADSRILIRSN